LPPSIFPWYWIASNAGILMPMIDPIAPAAAPAPAPCQGGDDGSCCDQRFKTKDRQCSDAYQPTKSGTEDYPTAASNCGRLKRSVVLQMSKTPVARLAGKKNRDIITLRNPPPLSWLTILIG
jgi:hypothetical protein